MLRLRWLIVSGVVVAILSAVLVRTAAGPSVALDGSPRIPDVEGVVIAIDDRHLILDDRTRIGIADDALLFSTYTRRALRPKPRTYVHVGLADADTASWIATIGTVARFDEAVVLYTGRVVDVSDRRTVFDDGTVLRLVDGLVLDVPLGFVTVEIDPERRRVVAIRPA